jgi:hypothetical protein
MKGNFSEHELHMMHERLIETIRSKAQRGEFRVPLPPGLIWDDLDRIQKSPDEQVQAVIDLVFKRFLELGTVNQSAAFLFEVGIELPVRSGKGGKLEWKPASYQRVHRVLTNPFLAGAYVYGRRQVEEFLDASNLPAKRMRERDQKEWRVFIKDHHEGYISWETFEKIQKQIEANCRCPKNPGAPREGPALLQGLVLCGRCGRNMKLRYGKGGRIFRYECRARRDRYGGQLCQGFGAKKLERAVEELVVRALEPLGVESMIRAADLHAEAHDGQKKHWQQRIERAEYEAEAARRSYAAVDPTNRLVARELESRFEEALRRVEATRSEAEARIRDLGSPLSEEDRARLRKYAKDLPLLWNEPTTRPQDKKRILRCLIRHVVLTSSEGSETLRVKVHWSGGEVSEVAVPRGKSGVTDNATNPEVIELVRDLAKEFSDEQIARILHRKHIRTATGLPFNLRRVMALRRTHTIPRGPKVPVRGDDVYTAEQAAEIFRVSRSTIIRWVEDGLLRGSQRTPAAPWRIQATEEDKDRLMAADAPEDWLTLKAAAIALRVSQQAVLQRLKAGKLQGIRVRVGRRSGWRIRIPESTYDNQLRVFAIESE